MSVCSDRLIRTTRRLVSAPMEEIKLVFPTLCSPKNTSLNFFNGEVEAEKSLGFGVDELDMVRDESFERWG